MAGEFIAIIGFVVFIVGALCWAMGDNSTRVTPRRRK